MRYKIFKIWNTTNITPKGDNMIQTISALNTSIHSIDSEYMRIILELRRLGLTPSGNKEIDKAKLARAKEELITKIKSHEQNSNNENLQIQTISPVENIENSKRAEMEEQRLGAMTIAELNRLYFGI